MTESGAKEWVTIRIPKDTRDRASNAEGTYEEIMQAGLDGAPAESGSVDAEEVAKKVAERLEGSKPIEDMAFEDWFEPDYATTIAREITAELDSETIGSVWAGDIEEQLDRIEAAAKEATNAAQTTQATVEELTSK